MADSYRIDRINRLFSELRYELERGMLEEEIGETLAYNFYVPISHAIPGGCVFCEFRSRPIPANMMHPDKFEQVRGLRLVKGGKDDEVDS